MKLDTRPYLDDLEERIDPEVEENLLAEWRTFCAGRCPTDVFTPRRRRVIPPGIEWPKVSTNQALANFDAMLLSQYSSCAWTLNNAAGRVMNVRANYGVPILAMAFGCELFVMAEETGSLPNCHPIGPEEARAWLDRGMPSLEHPYLQKVWEAGRRFAEVRKQYPRIGKYVWIYHPDFQGPMDILELIWGSEVFLAFVDEPETIHKLLTLITDFYIAAMKRWFEIVPPADERISAHWGLIMPGQVMIRDDSAMNLPPAYFEEFIRPYDQRILDTFGEGAIHACGRVDHWAGFLADMKGLKAFNMSQPELNDMAKVYRQVVDRGVLMLDLNAKAAQSAARNLRGRVQSW